MRVNPPKGAFYLFLDFSPFAGEMAARNISKSNGLCDRLLEDTGVALLPGAEFGRSRSELTQRLYYVDFDGTAALAASQNTPLDTPLPDRFLGHHCSA